MEKGRGGEEKRGRGRLGEGGVKWRGREAKVCNVYSYPTTWLCRKKEKSGELVGHDYPFLALSAVR